MLKPEQVKPLTRRKAVKRMAGGAPLYAVWGKETFAVTCDLWLEPLYAALHPARNLHWQWRDGKYYVQLMTFAGPVKVEP